MRHGIQIATYWTICLCLAAAMVMTVSCSPRPAPQPGVSISVDELMRKPSGYPGVIQVEGVVAETSSDRQMLALIDTQEYTDCASITCATLLLPVVWTGAMPELQDMVQVVGEVQQDTSGRLVFVAQALEKGQG